MAAINGINYANNISVPAVQSKPGEAGGVVKCLFDQYDGTPTAADVMSVGKLPKGARVLSIISVGLGSSPSYAKVLTSSGSSSTLAAGDLLAGESLIKVTIGTSPSANAGVAVLYVVD